MAEKKTARKTGKQTEKHETQPEKRTDKKIIAVIGATGAQGGGLVRAILNDKTGQFAARAITRNPNSDKAKALAEAGAEVVAADTDDVKSLKKAFADAYGAFCMTNFWE
ncbi:MAG: NmrA family NAD(P)-binding protein, partial [Gemmatimonadaceae bacterium]